MMLKELQGRILIYIKYGADLYLPLV